MDLNQVTIYSPQVEKLSEFYTSLGLKMIVDSIPRYTRFECPDGETTLSLHEAGSKAGGGIVLYFECEDLDARLAALAESRITPAEGPVDQPWLWREAHFEDPDGNRIVLFYAGENRKDAPWKVT